MQFRVIERGSYGDQPRAAVTVTPGDAESTVRLDLGQRNTGGWSIEPLSVSSDAGVLVVKTKINAPAAGSIVTQALTAPYVTLGVNARVTAARWVDENGKTVAESK
jgi:hypothetical protein